MKKILEHLAKYKKYYLGVLSAIAALIGAICGLSSCGSSVKASIRTTKDASGAHITITTNNPTTVSPKIDPSTTITIHPKENGKEK